MHTGFECNTSRRLLSKRSMPCFVAARIASAEIHKDLRRTVWLDIFRMLVQKHAEQIVVHMPCVVHLKSG
jgi:hypothetical protein